MVLVCLLASFYSWVQDDGKVSICRKPACALHRRRRAILGWHSSRHVQDSANDDDVSTGAILIASFTIVIRDSDSGFGLVLLLPILGFSVVYLSRERLHVLLNRIYFAS